MRKAVKLGLWTLAVAAFGYFVAGGLLYLLPIGLDWRAFPLGGVIERLFRALGYQGENAISAVFWLGACLLALWAAVIAARFGAKQSQPNALRRHVVTGGALLGATALASGAAALRALFGLGTGTKGWGAVSEGISGAKVETTHPSYPDAWKNARVQAFRTLGRTGWNVSDVVLGSGRIKDEKGADIVRLALDRGVTYVDTAPDYSAAGSEEAVGRAIRGMRDRVFLATKFCTPYGHLGAGTSVADYERAVEDSLRRLGTDTVDLVHVHACDELPRLMDPNMHEAFDRLRAAGKARFLGFSSHTPNLMAVGEQAIASGRFDVMMLAYHHGIWPRLGELIARARRDQNMGVIAMKTLKGAKHNGLAGFREQAPAYSQAALRWVLSNPDVSAAVISFFEFQHVDEYLQASGGSATPEDLALLGEYDRQIVGTYCAPHCGACLSHCPEVLSIPDVLRHRMYFEDYGDEKEAMRLYAQLEKRADVCTGCSAPCLGSCPVGIDIPTRTRGAHAMLTLA
ncbi:MAG TPA: aldo/keto reductase [Myxococcota bacterium]|nr:aldo/keto reductase [Myxococcota bacterium]